MASAHSLLVREKILDFRLAGYNMREISKVLSISYGSVRELCKRSAVCSGSADKSVLLPRYHLCGPQKKEYSLEVIEQSLALKRLHPLWGAGRISLALNRSCASAAATSPSVNSEKQPAIRSLGRWFRENNLIKPPRQTGEPTIGRAKAVHNIWEVDAKEQLTLQDGQAACYLTMVDEKSGAWLASPVFPL